MLPASLFPELALQPFHVQLMCAIVAGSGALALAIVVLGALRAWRQRASGSAFGEQVLPPIPQTFPFALDQIYTALFILFLLSEAVSNLFPTAQGSESAHFGWNIFILGIVAQIGIYLPMLVRYGLLHPMQRPTQPWWYYLGLPLLFWFCICLCVGMLELSGFSTWLVRTTGCPEHQDVVLIFSRGDTLQRLYIAICAVLIAPVAEECCFRGFLYTTLKRWGGRVAACIASALIFGAIHSSLAQMLPLTIFGVVQCIAYEKTRSLWLPIAIHMVFNTTSLIATCVVQP